MGYNMRRFVERIMDTEGFWFIFLIGLIALGMIKESLK
jgi:hypothetical protein